MEEKQRVKPRVQFNVSDDKRTIKLAITPGEAIASELSGIIEGFGQLRAQMLPAHMESPPASVPGPVIPHAWPKFAASTIGDGSVTFVLCHPGLGWLSFAWTKEEAAATLGDLQNAIMSASSSGRPSVN